MAWLAVALTVFTLLAVNLARTKAPWCDEGWFANPAYNLAFHGNMGTNVLEPSGHFLNAYLRGIQERTYVVVPNHMVAMAAWFRLFGFGLLTMRAYSILWGGMGICCLYYVLYRLFPDWRVAALTSLFLSLDFVYLWSSADGRMEACTNALSLGSLGAYLHFRQQSMPKAVFISQLLGAAAVFTHPNALLLLCALAVVALKLDRRRLRLPYLLLAGAPYLLFAALWTLYIVHSPGDFAAQFFANAAGRDSTRLRMIVQPWRAVWGELVRNLAPYCVSGLWSGVMYQWMIFIPLLYFAALGYFFGIRRTCAPTEMLFLTCTLVVLAAMTFVNGMKSPMYLIYLIPFYDTALAFGILKLWKAGRGTRVTAVGIAAAFCAAHLAEAAHHIRTDELHRDYLPAVAQLKQDQRSGKSIVGTAALGFGLGFQGFRDDWRLGLYSHLDPDVIFVDPAYREFIQKFEREEPLVFAHDIEALTKGYRLSRRFGRFMIFERLRGAPGRIDITGITSAKPGSRGEYVFKRIALEGEVLHAGPI